MRDRIAGHRVTFGLWIKLPRLPQGIADCYEHIPNQEPNRYPRVVGCPVVRV